MTGSAWDDQRIDHHAAVRATHRGFSLRWYITDPALSVLHDPSLRAALGQSLRIAV